MSEISLAKLSQVLDSACQKSAQINKIQNKDTPEGQKKTEALTKQLRSLITAFNEEISKESTLEIRKKGTRTTMNQILSILKSHAFLSRVLQEQIGIIQTSLLTDQETKEFEKFQKNMARIAKDLREAGKKIQATVGKEMLMDHKNKEEE